MAYFKALNDEINVQLDAFVEFARSFIGLDITAIYVLGSHTDNTAVTTSDIDIAIIYNDADEEYVAKIDEFFAVHSRNLFKTEIDLYLISLKQIEVLDKSKLLTREGILNVKLASELLYGEDIRDKIDISNINDYIQITIETPHHFMKKIRGLELTSTLQIDYPNKDDYYYGYLNHSAETHLGLETKPLLTLIGWIGTSLIALHSGKLIGKKSDVVKQYARYVNDEWTEYIHDAYDVIRGHLAYTLPTSHKEKEAIRKICEKLPAFELHYMKEYEKYRK
jgi:predicted nucleotidyltransferase